MAPKNKILRAVFDVRPVDSSGSIDFEKIENLTDTVVLRKKPATPPDIKLALNFKPYLDSKINLKNQKLISVLDKKNSVSDFHAVVKDFEKEFLSNNNPITELARTGARFYPKTEGRVLKRRGPVEVPKLAALPNIEEKSKEKISDESPELSKDYLFLEKGKGKDELEGLEEYFGGNFQNFLPVQKEIDALLEKINKNPQFFNKSKDKPAFYKNINLKAISAVLAKFKKRRNTFLLAIIPLFFILLAVKGGVAVKNDIIGQGNSAVANLEKAKADLENFNFLSAANNFAAASDNFSEATDSLNSLGASFASLFSELPGLGKIKNAKNLVKAGENIAQAGEDLSLAFNNFSGTNFVSYFGSENLPSKPLTEYVYSFRNSFIFAKNKIDDAAFLLAGIDASNLPEDKQNDFHDFKDKIPQFQKFAGEAVDYSDFLLKFTGSFSPQRYLILFQNNSELRPTGGFPGTYGILEFEKGFVKKIFVDDIYNIDGQIRKNIIPPLELQYITPVWGMRDANWFTDFPTSAKKVIEMYKLDGGQDVDGVLSVTPAVISDILKITGPIEMPEYGVTLDSDNFLSQIQEEVEYGDNRTQPKKIVADFTPKFFGKLALLEKENWIKVFEILVNAAYEKHILGYFENSELQEFALKNGIGGEVKNTQSDFLMVVHTNIKGSKTDAVIDNSIELMAEITEDGFIAHTLKITRAHNGSKTSLGFYNRQNPDYVRVFMPLGSELLSIKGNSAVSISPLVKYGSEFMVDEELREYESSAEYKNGVKIFPESGKTVIGFWMLTNPGKTEEVTIKYLTPLKADGGEYSILAQKQPATDSKFSFSFNPSGVREVISAYPDGVQLINGSFVFDSDLSVDRVIDLKWK